MDLPSAPIGNRAKGRFNLARSERRFRRLFEESPLGMVMLNRNLTVTRANRAFAAMLGYVEAELIGRRILELTAPSDRAATEASILRACEPEGQAIRQERCYLRADGAIVATRATSQAIRDDNGAPLYTLSIVEELTEWNRFEAAQKPGHEVEVAYLVEQARLDGVLLAANLTADRLGNALSLTRGYNELVLEQFELPERAREMLQESLLGLQLAVDHLRELQNIVRVVTRDTPLGPMLDVDASTQRDDAR
jgi:PAS domain S-box-containing protein